MIISQRRLFIDLNVRQVDLQDLSEAVWRDVTPSAPTRPVAFSCQIEESARYCTADAHWMRLVLFNLFRNAIEAMHATTAPRLQFTVERRMSAIQLSVIDNGCGLSPSMQARLFEPFFSTKGERGTGLGLSICRKIVELHSGQLTFDSESGNGARVEIRLPCDLRN